MKGIFKLGVILMLYTMVACVGLAFVYAGTKDAIEGYAQGALNDALKAIFPQGDSFNAVEGRADSPDSQVSFGSQYEIRSDGVVIGTAFNTSSGSYGGQINCLVGVGKDGVISGVSVLSHSDTPGLGANAADPSYFVDKATRTTFPGQFKGMPADSVFKVKGDGGVVDAITAATITSRAVSRSVQAAATAGSQWLSSR
jgi:electron transport complex protein RnfG